MTNQDQVIYGHTPSFESQGVRYFAPDSAAHDANTISEDPTARLDGDIKYACRVPSLETIKAKRLEVELNSPVPDGGLLEITLIINGQDTDIKFMITAGQRVGFDVTNVLIPGGSLFAYRYSPVGFSAVPSSAMTLIVDNQN